MMASSSEIRRIRRGLILEPLVSHRKRVRHYDEPGHGHCLTFSCYDRKQLLVFDEIRSHFLERLADVRQIHKYRILAYVIMPNHIHLLVRPQNDGAPIATFLHALKGPFGYRAKRILADHGRFVPRFWQTGPGFDDNVTGVARAGVLADYIHGNPVRKGLVESVTDWRWSSARYWAGHTECDLAMDEFE